MIHLPGRTRLDERGRVHYLPIYSRIKREKKKLLLGYPYHPTWYVWREHIRGCIPCVMAAWEDEVCDEGLEILNRFYQATMCRWETRPERDENAALWHRASRAPGLI